MGRVDWFGNVRAMDCYTLWLSKAILRKFKLL